MSSPDPVLVHASNSKSHLQRAIIYSAMSGIGTTLKGISHPPCSDVLAALRFASDAGAVVHHEVSEDWMSISPSAYRLRNGYEVECNVSGSATTLRIASTMMMAMGIPSTFSMNAQLASRDHSSVPLTVQDFTKKVAFEKNGERTVRIAFSDMPEIGFYGSSQPISGLMMAMAVPRYGLPTTIKVLNPRSVGYLDITKSVLESFGAKVVLDHKGDDMVIHVEPPISDRRTITYTAPGDWSSAAAIIACAVTRRVPITVDGLKDDLNPDGVVIRKVLEQMGNSVDYDRANGVVTVIPLEDDPFEPFVVNCMDAPDLVPVLMALAAFCRQSDDGSAIVGTSRTKNKESNRTEVMATILGDLGVEVNISMSNVARVHGNPLTITTRSNVHRTGDDHRIAMALQVLRPISSSPFFMIDHPRCVSKSYPTFYTDLDLLETA